MTSEFSGHNGKGELALYSLLSWPMHITLFHLVKQWILIWKHLFNKFYPLLLGSIYSSKMQIRFCEWHTMAGVFQLEYDLALQLGSELSFMTYVYNIIPFTRELIHDLNFVTHITISHSFKRHKEEIYIYIYCATILLWYMFH